MSDENNKGNPWDFIFSKIGQQFKQESNQETIQEFFTKMHDRKNHLGTFYTNNQSSCLQYKQMVEKFAPKNLYNIDATFFNDEGHCYVTASRAMPK